MSKEDLDNAQAAAEVADAKQAANQQALELAVLGPRKEELAENEARLQAQRRNSRFSAANSPTPSSRRRWMPLSAHG